MTHQRGFVYTFYSFKGGVGRSMAVANVAALLARTGKRVLVVDWDLEAPGLEKYFLTHPSSLSSSRSELPGVVDIVSHYISGRPIDWHDCIIYAYPFKEGKPVSIISAGKDNDDYIPTLQNINWELLFSEKKFGSYLEALREEWLLEYDFVLIDSRTGITDIGGICTIHLPDAIVLLFTANQQSVEGIKNVIDRVQKKYRTLPLDRSKLLAIPVPSRFEIFQEYKLAEQWKEKFATTFAEVYDDWLPDKITASDVLEKLVIPYVPFWSFGEGLPVVTEGTSDPRSVGFAYNTLARLLGNKLQWNQVFTGEDHASKQNSSERINKQYDSLIEPLSDFETDAVKNVLFRLIKFDETNIENDTTKKVFEKEFSASEKKIIEDLIKRKVLFRSLDSLTKETIIEISDPSIINYWEKLRLWVVENREFLLWRQKLDLKIHEWADNNQNKNYLLNTLEVNKTKKILQYRFTEMNEEEMRFINRSFSNERFKKYRKYLPYVIGFYAIIILGYFFYRFYLNQRKIQDEKEKELKVIVDSQNRMIDSLRNYSYDRYGLSLDSTSSVK